MSSSSQIAKLQKRLRSRQLKAGYLTLDRALDICDLMLDAITEHVHSGESLAAIRDKLCSFSLTLSDKAYGGQKEDDLVHPKAVVLFSRAIVRAAEQSVIDGWELEGLKATVRGIVNGAIASRARHSTLK